MLGMGITGWIWRILVIVEKADTRNKCFQYNVAKSNNETEQRVLRKHRGHACNSTRGLRDGFLKECRPQPLFNFTSLWHTVTWMHISSSCYSQFGRLIFPEQLFFCLSPLCLEYPLFCHHLCLSEVQIKCHLVHDGFSDYWNQSISIR